MLRKRWTVGALALATVLLVGGLPPTLASAAPSTTPTITSPLDGGSISSTPITVSATSTAAVVEFVLDSRGGAFTVDASVDISGNATADLPAAGIDGATTIQAFDCDGPLATPDCNFTTGALIHVTVNLPAPTIDSPIDGTTVSGSVLVQASTTNGGQLQFLVNGSNAGNPVGSPYSTTLTLSGKDGPFTLQVQQCDSSGNVCQGPYSSIVTVTKDTTGPGWTNVAATPTLFYPAKDHYIDKTVLSATTATTATNVRLLIKDHAGRRVKRFLLTRPSPPGTVSVTWDGRNGADQRVAPGVYSFTFSGADPHGVTQTSQSGQVTVSGKHLVRRRRVVHMTALQSDPIDYSHTCGKAGRLLHASPKPYFRGGLGYYSNAKCHRTLNASMAQVVHAGHVKTAIRYGKLTIAAYGGKTLFHGGPAHICYLAVRGKRCPTKALGTPVGWHAGPRVPAKPYIGVGGEVSWAVYTVSGAWYNVAKFRITYWAYVLVRPRH
jgi:hypothetical protein